ncbi:unnamed protein product (macronuclear) [Paramecium tetraurelia]|uniref:Uncharacterized protein n=1 Tax=Paramecium tetraurelia TaxID=5888 RepID=A0E6Y5_PARTE|nr:uncharacterized protein GSPATT00023780001 [Paramecium tetraurelia]CAK91052.1 unnamed protein product [Paramecium tetraurelia]|eukprot:XP_001458449.1 hypothetical protein (macronuclear) [Paramecium tetraurelia strain d4-2]
MNKQERENVKQRIEERIFQIKLKNTQHEVVIGKNANFTKIIEQEYATKYLESLGIEANQKNIQMILKNYPLNRCEITGGWNTSGLYADTINIVVRQKKKNIDLALGQKDKDVLDEVQKEQDLKKITIKKGEQEQDPQLTQQQIALQQKNEVEQQKELLEKEEEKKIKFKLDFSLEEIKHKYLFPFNQTFQRKQNQNMVNQDRLEFQQNDETHSEHDKFLVFESKIFQLPFIHIEIPAPLLKDVQRPPNIKPEDIEKVLKQIDKLFPKSIFPIKASAKSQEKQQQQQQQLNKEKVNDDVETRYIVFEKHQVDNVFQLIQKGEMVKLIGLFIHLSYWLVFGVTLPIQIQTLTKKQMYIQMMEIIESFQSFYAPKLWMHLVMPMILVSLKMATEYLYKNHYIIFFEKPRTEINTPGNIAMDKIFHFADRLFDQNNLFCRFIFLESSKQKKIGNDAKFMHKRIFGVSPYLDIMIQNPQNSRTRAIIAKQRDIDIRDKILTIGEKKLAQTMPPILRQQSTKEEKDKIEMAQKAKMFSVVLSRMQQDFEKVLKEKEVLKLKQIQC